MIFNMNGGGNGAAALNFKVVGGTSTGGSGGSTGGSVYPEGAFAPVTTFTDGKQYALVSVIDGVRRYINTTTYNNYTMNATQINIAEDTGDYVVFNSTPALFTAVASGNGFLLQNGNNYLHGTTSNGTALRVGTTQAVWTVDASETGGFSSGKYYAKEDANAVWLVNNTGGYDWSIKFETAGSFGFDRSGRDNTYSTGFVSFVLYEYVAGESYGGGSGETGGVVLPTLPSNPTENTIWVDTSTAVSSWDFSATEPPRRSNNKNLVVYPYHNSTHTGQHGITWTDNADGTVKANGTASEKARFYFSHNRAGFELTLPAGTYKLSGCPSGGSASTYFLEASITYDNWNTTSAYPKDTGNGVTITLTATAKLAVYIIVQSGASVSNLVFKPQLEVGSSATSFVKGDSTGQVWISTGTSVSSTTFFNTLKKNGLWTYPISAKQYENGAWVDKTAKSYQYGAWVDWWDGTLFDISNPTKYERITGGWTSEAKYFESGNGTPTQINPELNDTYLRFWIGGSWYGYGMAWLVNKINLTNYDQIIANATIGTNSSARARLTVWSSIGEYITSNIVAEAEVQSGVATTLSVSGLSGEYYVGFYLGCGENGYKYIDLTKLYCT